MILSEGKLDLLKSAENFFFFFPLVALDGLNVGGTGNGKKYNKF